MKRLAATILMLIAMSFLIGVPIASAARTKIVMFQERPSAYGQGYYDWVKATADKFMQENPDIEFELIDDGNYAVGTITTLLVSGVQLDIAHCDPYVAIKFGKEGVLADLSPYIAREADQFSNWHPAGLTLFRSEGRQLALPKNLQIGSLFYNKTAYSEAGLASPGGNNWTYATLQANALRLQKQDADNKITRWGWKFPTWRNWLPIIWAFGGDFVDKWDDPSAFTGNTSQTTASLQYIRDLTVSGAIINDKSADSLAVTSAFMSQRIAMGQSNTMVFGNFKETIKDFEWDVLELPSGPAGHSAMLNAVGYVIMQESKNKDAAWRVLSYFTNRENLAAMVAASSLFPPDRRNLSQWISGYGKLNVTSVLKGIEMARAPGVLDQTMFDIIQKQVTAVRWGEVAITAALDIMKDLVGERIAELKAQVTK